MEADLIKPEPPVLPDPALGNASTPSFTPIATPVDSVNVAATHEPTENASPAVHDVPNATSSPSISFSYLSRSTSMVPINADSTINNTPQTEVAQPQQPTGQLTSPQVTGPSQPQEQSIAQAQAAAALDKRPLLRSLLSALVGCGTTLCRPLRIRSVCSASALSPAMGPTLSVV